MLKSSNPFHDNIFRVLLKSSFLSNEQIASLANSRINTVFGLNKFCKIDVMMKVNIVDVYINRQ
jgi:hypothetical protein